LFTGDTLFPGGPGNTKTPTGDFPTIIRSIRERLFTLPPDTRVYPGHGADTTIGAEAPYLDEGSPAAGSVRALPGSDYARGSGLSASPGSGGEEGEPGPGPASRGQRARPRPDRYEYSRSRPWRSAPLATFLIASSAA